MTWHSVYDKVQALLRGPAPGEPRTFIQWKGTDVCIDVHCTCGHSSHWDRDFLYALKCPECARIWHLGTQIQMVELSAEEAAVFGGFEVA